LKISVIGVGAQGSAIVFLLAKAPEVSEVVCADIDLNRARQVVEELKSDKVYTERVDAGKLNELVRVLKGADTVINATHPRFNINVMNAALKSGTSYVDLASNVPCKYWVPKELALDSEFKNAGLTAVVNQGGPFTTQVAVRYVADRLDRVDEIRLRLGGRLVGPQKREFIPSWRPSWCPEIALTEWLQPTVYENGTWKDVPPFSGVEEYPFPEPVGKVTVCYVDYEPVQTLPRFIKGVKYVEMKQQPDIMAGALIKMGLASNKPIDVKGVKVAPRDVLLALIPPAVETSKRTPETESFGCYLAEIKGEKDNEKVTYTVYKISSRRECLEKWGTTGAYVALPSVLTAIMLAKGEIKTKGVIPPEGLEPEPFLAKLAEKGWVFQERITKEIRP